ncbi:MAG: hypothetical protein J0M13_06025 [Candidatus Accumulibacter sp.]|jgi:hypothetical protein|nr:hypothetical protein [Candidatus Accumulibacter necessarius]
MAHRVNIVLDDDVWQRFQAIPGGERSRFVNEVISVELLRRQQQQAWAGIQSLRGTLPPIPGRSEDWVREDRDALP